MSARHCRRLAVAVGAVLLAAAVPEAAWAGQPAASPRLAHSGPAAAGIVALTALKFSAASVDATTGTALVTLTWTITDTAPQAGRVVADLKLASPAASPGTYQTEVVPVRLSSGGQAAGKSRRYAYRYAFHVPQWAQASSVTWQVIHLTATDGRHDRLVLNASQLMHFGATLTATELVDTSPPTYNSLQLDLNESPARPYVYAAAGQPGGMLYGFTVNDNLSGISYGSIQVAGPRGHTLNATFSYDPGTGQCGYTSGGGATSQSCSAALVFPPGTLAGTWKLSRMQLTDEAGNTATFTGINGVPVVVTSDQIVHASNFRASPNPVNDWTQLLTTVHLQMKVTGTRNGISAIYVDTQSTGGNCTQGTGAPKISGASVSVPITVYSRMQLCQIYGVAIVDGKGEVSLYGQEYAAPDPYLLIRQLPDTTPPTVTSAVSSPKTVKASQLGSTQLTLTLHLHASIAPVDGASLSVYNSAGKVVDSIGGGASPYQGILTESLPLNSGMTPGTYTIGFSITDAGYLTTTYGPGGRAVPGGPLKLTVTSG